MKPEVAQRQLDAEVAAAITATPSSVRGAAAPAVGGAAAAPGARPQPASPRKLRRFHGSVALDATRLGRDAGRIAEEVVAHLAGLPKADVDVSLEIEARIPDGAPDHVVRTVTENSRTLKFKSQGFEED